MKRGGRSDQGDAVIPDESMGALRSASVDSTKRELSFGREVLDLLTGDGLLPSVGVVAAAMAEGKRISSSCAQIK